MFGHFKDHEGSHRMRQWMMAGEGRGHRGHRHGGGGPFGRHRGGPFGGRGPRTFDAGALRLVVLGLIAEEPRHGYDIIKALEAKFQGSYSPSPGAIYPLLQMLEEADLVVSEAQGNKRLFSITDEGRAYLAENAADLERINRQIEETSASSFAGQLGEEVRAFMRTVFQRLRGGTLTPEQARELTELLRNARKDLGDL